MSDGVMGWRTDLLRRGLDAHEVDRLEERLRSEMARLRSAGLDEAEALLIGVRRLGDVGASTASARAAAAAEGSVRGSPAEERSTREGVVALALAVAAGVAIKAPEPFGLRWDGVDQGQLFYLRNLSLFVLPFLAGFFAWQRDVPRTRWPWLAAPFVVGALAVNLLPFAPEGDTQILAVLHLPIALWLAVGVAHAGGAWRSHEERMGFVRFSGEWFIYYALIALGGGVLMGITAFVFGAIGLDPETLLAYWILPCGAMGAVVIAAWLVGARQGVVESLAPMLTMLFTPLFTLLLLAFLGTMAVTGAGIAVERDVLIGFDLLLAVVVGLLLYAIASRPSDALPGFFDWLQLVLVVCALLVDALALWAILARITEFGFTPNRVAALGENLILVANLAGSAVLYVRFVRGRAELASLQRWQTRFLPVYAAWAWIVVVGLGVAFGFR